MPHHTEGEDIRRRMAKWEKASEGTNHMFFAVCLEETVIGYAAFNKRPDSYEIGYCFHYVYVGKGYAKESSSALSAYRKALGIRKLSARTAIRNLPSVSFLKSLGFCQNGTEKVSFYKDSEGNDILFDGGIFELDL